MVGGDDLGKSNLRLNLPLPASYVNAFTARLSTLDWQDHRRRSRASFTQMRYVGNDGCSGGGVVHLLYNQTLAYISEFNTTLLYAFILASLSGVSRCDTIPGPANPLQASKPSQVRKHGGCHSVV